MIVLRVVCDLDFSPGQEVNATSIIVGDRMSTNLLHRVKQMTWGTRSACISAKKLQPKAGQITVTGCYRAVCQNRRVIWKL